MPKSLFLLLVAIPALAQNRPIPLQVTRIYNINPSSVLDCGLGCIDNRSTATRSNNYHSFQAIGTGTWSVSMQYSDASSSGPWFSFGASSTVDNTSSSGIGFGTGYHPFLLFSFSGANAATVSVTYAATKDFYTAGSASSVSFPIGIGQGGTGGTNPIDAKANISVPFLNSNDFSFSPQAPGGSLLSGGVNQPISLSPCPRGLNGSDASHYVYLSGGSGVAEAVAITGGTCTSGAASGTITVTPANNHSGAWTVQSATVGIQEAVCYASSASSTTVYIPAGPHLLNADVSFCGKSNIELGVMPSGTVTGSGALPASNNLNQTYYISPNSQGAVVMRRPNIQSFNWLVFLPDGRLLDTTGDICQGLQAAVNYAQQHAYPLVVQGGGITPPGLGTITYSNITCSDTLAFPTGYVNSYNFYGVNLSLNPVNLAHDGMTIDSSDMTELNFHNSQIGYIGTGAAIHFLPLHDNGETFVGFFLSRFSFGTIVPVVSAVNGTPDPTKATALEFSMPLATTACGGGSCINGNGKIASIKVDVSEINGGLHGVVIDNPASPNSFAGNELSLGSVHGQGSESLLVGTSAAAAGLIGGNTYRGTFSPSSGGTGFSIWGGAGNAFQWQGDLYECQVGNGTTGFILNSSAQKNLIIMSEISAGTAYVNNATEQTNRLVDTRLPQLGSFSPGGSPWTWQNNLLQDVALNLNFGTTSLIELSADGTTWVSVGTTTPFTATIRPGAYIRVTYTVAPNVKYIQ